jgi:hypothetical protein
MENISICNGHLDYFINYQFGTFNGHTIPIWYNLFSLGIFFPFWYVVPKKIWQP